MRTPSVDWEVMCLSLELDFQKVKQKNYRIIVASGDTSKASRRHAVSVPATPSWRALVLFLESAARRHAETLLREFFALKLQRTVIPLAMTQSLMMALALAEAAR